MIKIDNDLLYNLLQKKKKTTDCLAYTSNNIKCLFELFRISIFIIIQFDISSKKT